MTAEPNPGKPELNEEDAIKDAPKDPDQSVDSAAAEKKAAAEKDAETEGTLNEDELADEQGEESFPASDAPANY